MYKFPHEQELSQCIAIQLKARGEKYLAKHVAPTLSKHLAGKNLKRLGVSVKALMEINEFNTKVCKSVTPDECSVMVTIADMHINALETAMIACAMYSESYIKND